MLNRLRTLFGPAPSGPLPSIPAGERVYAVGDVHGRLDLFEAAISAIEADDAACRSAQTTIILLGDLIDRGPDSAGVIAAARAWEHHLATPFSLKYFNEPGCIGAVPTARAVVRAMFLPCTWTWPMMATFSYSALVTS